MLSMIGLSFLIPEKCHILSCIIMHSPIVFCTIVLGLNLFLNPRGMIPRGVSFFILKFEYLSEKQTKIENGSNGELNWRSKISLTCPFK